MSSRQNEFYDQPLSAKDEFTYTDMDDNGRYLLTREEEVYVRIGGVHFYFASLFWSAFLIYTGLLQNFY